MKRFWCARVQSSSACAVFGGVLHRVGHVFQDRPGRAEHHAYPLVLRQTLHLQRARQIDVLQVGQRGGVVGDDRNPQLLVDAGGQPVGAGQHQVDVHSPGVLLRLDLARQFRRRRLREGDLRHQLRVRLGVGLHRALGELQLARHVDDVERDRRGGQRRSACGPRGAGAERGKSRRAAQQVAAAGHDPAHGCFSRSWCFRRPGGHPPAVARQATLISLTSQQGDGDYHNCGRNEISGGQLTRPRRNGTARCLEHFHPDWNRRAFCHCEERSDEAISRPMRNSAAYRAGDCFVAALLAMTGNGERFHSGWKCSRSAP